LIGVVGLALGKGIVKNGPIRGQHGWRQIVESLDLMEELGVFIRVKGGAVGVVQMGIAEEPQFVKGSKDVEAMILIDDAA
jgi:hypothetical protein